MTPSCTSLLEKRVPDSAVQQLRRLVSALREALPTLAGVILHGSAATTGFEPRRSDLDVLAIVSADPGTAALKHAGQAILHVSGDPHPLEISVLLASDVQHWHHPCPHLLHFGEDHRARFEAGLFVPQSATDVDLAMHVVVAKARGIVLLGSFPLSELPEVPRADFLDAILADFAWVSVQDEDLSDYEISNACRTLAYLREGLVLSKSEGRRWCADHGVDTCTVVSDVVQALQAEVEKPGTEE